MRCVKSSLPGPKSPPYDHGESWAIFAAVEGGELYKVSKNTFLEPSPIALMGEVPFKRVSAISLLHEGVHPKQMDFNAHVFNLHHFVKGLIFMGRERVRFGYIKS